MPRPRRIRFADPDGQVTSLATGPQAFESLLSGKEASLVLGLGPEPSSLTELCATKPVYWIEHPEFIARMEEIQTGWLQTIPETWQRIQTHALPNLPLDTACFFYRQNLRLFPDFWGAVRASLLARSLPAATGSSRTQVLLPGTDTDLLTQELTQALRVEGFDVIRPKAACSTKDLLALLHNSCPAFCLSVNLRGCDPEGNNFYLLRECGVPTVIWLVDMPWHILSALRTRWWCKAILCVSDASFIPALKAAGAQQVFHLPLAAWHFAPPAQPADRQLERIVFVGRSAFPGKAAFFGASTVPEALLEEARELLAQVGTVPDFHWWSRKLAVQRYWPGHEARRAGLGAESSALTRRTQWLRAALPLGLTVFGDADWRRHLPELEDLRPPVDYYKTAQQVYAQARYSLNCTSLLLPAALTQRHFDVWAAGGFLLSAPTPGLDIFPQELGREICPPHPAKLAEYLGRFENGNSLRSDLQKAWQACLVQKHQYRHRVQYVCELLSNLHLA